MTFFNMLGSFLDRSFNYFKKIKDVLLGFDDDEILRIMDKMHEKDIVYFRKGNLEIRYKLIKEGVKSYDCDAT